MTKKRWWRKEEQFYHNPETVNALKKGQILVTKAKTREDGDLDRRRWQPADKEYNDKGGRKSADEEGDATKMKTNKEATTKGTATMKGRRKKEKIEPCC